MLRSVAVSAKCIAIASSRFSGLEPSDASAMVVVKDKVAAIMDLQYPWRP